jgi:hypothetical protein
VPKNFVRKKNKNLRTCYAEDAEVHREESKLNTTTKCI